MGRFVAKATATLTTILMSCAACPTLSQECVPPPEGLVSWWPGDGHTADIADNNPGTFSPATFAPAKVGSGFMLDGIYDFVEVPDAPNLHLEEGDFTIAAWVRITGPNTRQYDLLDKQSSPSVVSGFLVHTLTGGILRCC